MDRRKFVQFAAVVGSQIGWPAFAEGLGRQATSTQDSERLIITWWSG